ncbi:hypothetical protein GGX14DRAFT_397339 [Mycena pura]|uniref:Uncharacterized protein n=1 Tax=Mycena pura TaxID=153505 RepID=A0AAD6VCM0_9AGAR|nr:hypothetical protein GGX14DRAFT_397339 [Mycena pura]
MEALQLLQDCYRTATCLLHVNIEPLWTPPPWLGHYGQYGAPIVLGSTREQIPELLMLADSLRDIERGILFPATQLCPSLTAGFKHINETLRVQLEIAHNNLNMRSAVEIVTTTLKERSLNLSDRTSGVQPTINDIVAGRFDARGIRFQDAEGAVFARLTAQGGIQSQDVAHALKTLYHELSKTRHRGVSKILTVRDGEQPLAEAIAALSLILFARRLYGSSFNACFMDEAGITILTLSDLG